MKNKDFDNIDKLAQDAFEHFEVPLPSGDWMDFQQQLDSESAIDNVAKGALGGYEVPLDPNSWKEFEKIHQRKKGGALYVWWYKAAEAGVMALFLLGTFLNIPCSKKSTNSNSLAYGSTATLNSSTVINKEDGTTTTVKKLSESVTIAGSNAANNTTTPAHQKLAEVGNKLPINNGSPNVLSNNSTATAPVPTTNTTRRYNNTAISAASSTTNQATAVKSTANNKTTTASATPPTTEATLAAPLSSIATEENIALNQAIANNTEIETTSTPATSNNTVEQVTSTVEHQQLQLEQLLAISSQTLQLTTPAKQEKTIEPITTIGEIELKAPHICRQYIGGVLGVGANMGTSMGKTSIGYSGGLTYEKEFSSKISLSIGLSGSYKRYDRTDLITLDRSILDGQIYEMKQVKSSNLVLIEIPLDVNYTCFRSDKWRIYATAGISANAIISRTYVGTQEVDHNNLSMRTALNSNDFERGLIEGGVAQQNIYLSLGGGFGVERKLGDNLSLYLLPTYRQGINAVHNDLIHTFNVNIGIKKAL